MKIFLSSLSLQVIKMISEIIPTRKPNVLVTFYGLTNPMNYTKINRNIINGLILDCGAFSLNDKGLSKGAFKIESDNLFLQYRDYTRLAQDDYDFLFSFDDDFTANGFDHNYERLTELENAGVKAVPVVHNLHNHEIDYFIENKLRYPIVAIGQCPEDKRGNLEVLFSAVDKLYREGVKVHIFGMSTPSLISHVPAYSCDSISWGDYASRGRALYYNPLSASVDKEDVIYFPSKQYVSNTGKAVIYNHYEYLDRFREHIKLKLNLELEDLIASDSQVLSLMLVNALYFIELEERITEDNRLRGITFD